MSAAPAPSPAARPARWTRVPHGLPLSPPPSHVSSGMRGEGLSIAYVHYGVQSGVTAAIAGALGERGHDVRLVAATGDLEPRDLATRRLRPAPQVLAHLAMAAARFGRLALRH